MNESAQLVELLNKKEKLVAMLAPSFPVVYKYPQIITRLKKLGFSYVAEVSAGAANTNQQLVTLLQQNPQARFITSPCASFVRMARTKYPHLLQYLAFKADSPMVATAKIVSQKYPGYRPVFVGPCVAKKLEASEDNPDLGILVVTYKEIEQIFSQFNVADIQDETGDFFDIEGPNTRIYPMDGGLTLTSGANRILTDEQFRIVSGWKNCDAVLQEFQTNPKIRLVDILFCEGGCINGPGITSNLTITERKGRIIEYAHRPIKPS